MAEEVRLIDENGKQLGIVPVSLARERAMAKSLDLVEVAPDSDPPVCRIMDYTKYVFEQKRKQKLAKKKTQRVEIKEIKFRPNIDPHDFEIKIKHARDFLDKGHKVKITMRYRPREMRHYEIGTQVIDRVIGGLGDIAQIEASGGGRQQVRTQAMMLTPKRQAAVKKENPDPLNSEMSFAPTHDESL